MSKKSKKQSTVLEAPEVEVAETPIDETQPEVQEIHIEKEEIALDADSQFEPKTAEPEVAETPETSTPDPSPSPDEAPISGQTATIPDAGPDENADLNPFVVTWRAGVAEIMQQPRMRRGYTQRAISLAGEQVAMVEDVARFRQMTANRVIQTTLSGGLNYRFALIANTLLGDPTVATDPRDLDALMLGWLEGQIAKTRSEAQESDNPVSRGMAWQRVARMEEIHRFFGQHPAFME